MQTVTAHASSGVSVQKVQRKDFEQVANLYYRYLLGDIVGYCGRRVFIKYLESLSTSEQGSVFCAVNEEGRITGFTASVIDKQRFDRDWVKRNILLIGLMIITKLLFSKQFRVFIFKRMREKFKGTNAIHAVDCSEKVATEAYSKWVVVDEGYRSKGNNLAGRLLASIEKDVKEKGAIRIYGFTERTNLASIFMHKKNGWDVVDYNEKTFKLIKELK